MFTASIVALDADTGTLKWHYQFTPHDVHDWDSTQVPVLGELPIDGQTRKVVMFANRNGFFYTIDRVTGKLIVAKPFVEKDVGREIPAPPPAAPGCCPTTIRTNRACARARTLAGAPTSCRRRTIPALRLFFVTARETCAVYFGDDEEFKVGAQFEGGGTDGPLTQKSGGALRAIDPITAERKWEFRYPTTSGSGVLTTASGWRLRATATATCWRSSRRAGNTCGTTSLAPPCATPRARPTCSTAGSTCSYHPARR